MNNLYNYRPPIYFALLLVAVASIILDTIWLNKKKRSHIFIILFKIIVLSLSVYALIYFAFPGVYGGDTWEHNYTVQQLVNSGQIPKFKNIGPFDNYYNFPIFHILGGVTQILTSLNSYSAIFVSVGLSCSFILVFVFLIGRKIADVKTGLLATLVVSLSDWTIERATEIIPNSLGFCFFLILIYLIFSDEERDIRKSFLIIILSITLIFTHIICSLITLIVIIVIFIGAKMYDKMPKTNAFFSFKGVTLSLIAIFGIMMLGIWILNRPIQSGSLFFEILIGFKLSLESQAGLVFSPLNLSYADYFVRLWSSGAFQLLLLGLAIFGSLIFLHSKNRSGARLGLMMSAGTLFIIIYTFQLFGLKNIVPERWFPFAYVLLAILAMFGLLNMSAVMKNKIAKLNIVILPILIIVFLMTTNTVGNPNNPLIYNRSQRMGKTASELISVQALWEMGCGCPTVDLRYGITVPYIIGANNYTELLSRDNKIFISRNYYLQNPEWNEKYSDKITDAYVWHSKADYYVLSDYAKRLGIDSKPLIYDNGNVKAYLLNQ